MPDTTVTVRLPEEKVRHLRRIAGRDNKTLTDVIEESVDRTLAAETNADNLATLSYAIGRCSSGGTDVTRLSLGEILERKRREGHL